MDIHIDLPIPYKDNYQMRMLETNEIPGIITVKGSGRDGHSRYTYRVKQGISIEKKYSIREMKQKDVEEVITAFTETAEAASGYLLDPAGFLLSPELIYTHDGKYSFCYLPVLQDEHRIPICSAFHQLTEYFVKRLDYHDTKGVFLVYRLHKETMKESYDLRRILEEYREEEQEYEKDCGEAQGVIPQSAVFEVDIKNEEEAGRKSEEKNKKPGLLKKTLSRLRMGRWGEWDDLITEIDRHTPGSNL